MTEQWEQAGNGCVEGPEPFLIDGKYYLLYSGASTWTGSYAVGVAMATSPLGPFVKKGPPILQSGRVDGIMSSSVPCRYVIFRPL